MKKLALFLILLLPAVLACQDNKKIELPTSVTVEIGQSTSNKSWGCNVKTGEFKVLDPMGWRILPLKGPGYTTQVDAFGPGPDKETVTVFVLVPKGMPEGTYKMLSPDGTVVCTDKFYDTEKAKN